MGTTLRAAPSKIHAFSTNYHACIAMPTWRRYAPPILFWPWPPYNLLPRLCLTWIFFVDPHWWVPLLAAPSKSYMPFQQIIMHTLHYQHDSRCAPPILFWPWPPHNLLPRSCFTWIFFVDPHWWVPLCVQCPAKAMPFKQIIMHAWQCQHVRCRCSPPILFWHLPPFNLFPRSCITWIFFVDSHWWVPICVQHPTIYMPFRQIIMYILQCPHDMHVHLFCFDLHKFLLRSRAVTCPTSNCGRRTSLFPQELVSR